MTVLIYWDTEYIQDILIGQASENDDELRIILEFELKQSDNDVRIRVYNLTVFNSVTCVD